MEMSYISGGLFLNKRKYNLDLLKICKIDHSNNSTTHMVSSYNLSTRNGSPFGNDSEYMSTVGTLQLLLLNQKLFCY